MKISRKICATSLVLVFGFAVAACGSDSSSSKTSDAPAGTTAGTGATDTAAGGTAAAGTAATDQSPEAGVARAKEDIAGLEIPPKDIGPTIPLKSKPPVKTVAWLECSLPSCQAIGVGFKNATDALGWKLDVISWTTDAAAAAQQAIDTGVDYIAITGTAPELIQTQIDAAKAKGIGFYSCFDTADPGQDANNLYIQCGDETAVTTAGERIANKIIVDSNGTANVLMVNIPDFAVLKAEQAGSQAAYDKNCPNCKFKALPLTLDQLLAGDVPGAVVTALQADPSIDYVHFAFDGLAGGVSQTLAAADLLKGRNLVGVDFSGAILQEIVDGTQKFWTANPKEYSAWLMVDAMARQSIGQDNPEERANAILPSFIVATAAEAQKWIPTNGWPGPEGMAEQFKTLWGV